MLLRMLQENVNVDSTELIKNTNFEIKRAQQCLERLVKGNKQIQILNDRTPI